MALTHSESALAPDRPVLDGMLLNRRWAYRISSGPQKDRAKVSRASLPAYSLRRLYIAETFFTRDY